MAARINRLSAFLPYMVGRMRTASGLTGDRIYAVTAPQNAPLPRIVYHVIYGGGTDYTHDSQTGDPAPAETLIQFDVRAATFTEARRISDDLELFWSAFTGGDDKIFIESCFKEGDRVLHDDDLTNTGKAGGVTVSTDFQFSWRERTPAEVQAETFWKAAYPSQFPQT